MPPQSDPEQCALDDNGQLKDANNIQWFNSPSDKTCIPLPHVEGETVADGAGTPCHTVYLAVINPSITAPHARPQRNKNAGLQDILTAERLNEWGDLDKKHRQPKRRPKRNTKRVKVMDNLPDLDPDDDNDDYNDKYQTEEVDSSTSEATQPSNNTSGDISNNEVSVVSPLMPTFLLFSYWFQLANVLPSKMVPARMRRAHAAKRKRSAKMAGDDAQHSGATSPGITPSNSFVAEGSSKEAKQVSLFAGCTSTSDQNHPRYQTQYTTSTRLSRVHHKALKPSLATAFTNAIMVGGRL